MAKWAVSSEPVQGTTHLIVHDPTRASCGAWVVASARIAGPAQHDYFFYFTQNHIYMYNFIQYYKHLSMMFY
jgi:hypothetical protein